MIFTIHCNYTLTSGYINASQLERGTQRSRHTRSRDSGDRGIGNNYTMSQGRLFHQAQQDGIT